jgi:hypothetical protein
MKNPRRAITFLKAVDLFIGEGCAIPLELPLKAQAQLGIVVS